MMRNYNKLSAAAISALFISALALPAMASAQMTGPAQASTSAYTTESPMVSNNASTMDRSVYSDAQIKQKVGVLLASNGKTHELDVTVNAANGVVTLYGTVNTKAQRAEVIRLAKSVEGVTSVKSQSLVVQEVL